METTEFLRRTSLFSGFSDESLGAVTGTAKERTFEAGTAMIKEGHSGQGFYLVLAGAAEVRKGETVLARFGVGDYFGEMALLLDDTPRTADVVAIEEIRCLVITSWDLRALIKSHPQVGVEMMAELAKRLRNTDAALSD
ncbi:cyclic nucleotide-binding domain-containing protein [bacterium]|nr:cyclic nucleotide-binding domain-containing protein [bacterium]